VINIDDLPPKKIFFSIKEVAQLFNLNESTLRYWETEFHQLKPKRQGKQRSYTKQDIELINQIYFSLKQQQLTIEGTRKALKESSTKTMDSYHLIQNLSTIKNKLLKLKNTINDTLSHE
jgi:DNA-binding transcriptional MerR regulator